MHEYNTEADKNAPRNVRSVPACDRSSGNIGFLLSSNFGAMLPPNMRLSGKLITSAPTVLNAAIGKPTVQVGRMGETVISAQHLERVDSISLLRVINRAFALSPATKPLVSRLSPANAAISTRPVIFFDAGRFAYARPKLR